MSNHDRIGKSTVALVEPVLTVKTYKSNDYCHEVVINGPCKVIYSPDKPLSCGARVWIETEADLVLKENNND